MPLSESLSVRQLTSNDVKLMEDMLTIFGQAFDDTKTYNEARPDKAYLKHLLSSDYFITVVALVGNSVVGGLAAYELKKFEQRRSEIYIYDLAVEASFRRQGIATALIQYLRKIAAKRGTYVIFVQADIDDIPAIELYTKLGMREDVLHFDIPVLFNDGVK